MTSHTAGIHSLLFFEIRVFQQYVFAVLYIFFFRQITCGVVFRREYIFFSSNIARTFVFPPLTFFAKTDGPRGIVGLPSDIIFGKGLSRMEVGWTQSDFLLILGEGCAKKNCALPFRPIA